MYLLKGSSDTLKMNTLDIRISDIISNPGWACSLQAAKTMSYCWNWLIIHKTKFKLNSGFAKQRNIQSRRETEQLLAISNHEQSDADVSSLISKLKISASSTKVSDDSRRLDVKLMSFETKFSYLTCNVVFDAFFDFPFFVCFFMAVIFFAFDERTSSRIQWVSISFNSP